MMKKLMGIAVLGAVLGGVMATAATAVQQRTERFDDAEVQAVIDARLHQLLVQMNAKR